MQENEYRPVIGISAARTDSPHSLAAIVSQVRTAGAIPRVFGSDDFDAAQQQGVESYVKTCLDSVDAVYVMGNRGDLNPAAYGDAKVHPKTKIETDNGRRDFETEVVAQALEMKMPYVGICGGLQRLNTHEHAVYGGTLMQHVPDVVGNELHNQELEDVQGFVPTQIVRIEEGSLLAEVSGSQLSMYTPAAGQTDPLALPENSFHHQAVGVPHKEFRVCAMSDDGIIEAIEPKQDGKYVDQFVLGVQWHPEFSASDFGPKLANRMVAEARAYAQERTPSHAQRIRQERAQPNGPVIGM